MTTDETQYRFQQALRVLRSGDRQTAATLMREVVRADCRFVPVWLWMSELVDQPAHKFWRQLKEIDFNDHAHWYRRQPPSQPTDRRA